MSSQYRSWGVLVCILFLIYLIFTQFDLFEDYSVVKSSFQGTFHSIENDDEILRNIRFVKLFYYLVLNILGCFISDLSFISSNLFCRNFKFLSKDITRNLSSIKLPSLVNVSLPNETGSLYLYDVQLLKRKHIIGYLFYF